jgi:AcrR family transcriptional regulator
MDDIAREAHMSRPAVYQYVRNKEAAFRRLAEELLDEAVTQAHTAAGEHDELSDQLTAALETKLALTLQVWRDSPAHAAELLGENSRLSGDLVTEYEAAMLELLSRIVAAARPQADADELAALLLAFARGLEADQSSPHAPVRRLRRGVELIVAGLDHTEPSAKERS